MNEADVMSNKLTISIIVSFIMSALMNVSSYGSPLNSVEVLTTNPAASPNNLPPLLPKQSRSAFVPYITLGTTNTIDTPLYQQAKRIMSAALQQLGYRLIIKTLPNIRSLAWANSGITDGDLFRIEELNLSDFPNLQQVNEPLFTIDQAVLSKKNIKVNGWESMKKYSVAYERGTQFIKNKENYFKRAYLVNNIEQAIAMVFHDRVDLTVSSYSTATKLLEKNKEYAKAIKILHPPLTRITLHVYLNKQRHKKLAKQLSLVLKQMKKTGQFQDLLKEPKSNIK